jgi:hypothetical protein
VNTLSPGMTRAFCLLISLVTTTMFSSSLMAADCTGGHIRLSNQAEVDGFQATYGGGGTCDRVTGSLRLRGNDIADLSPLSDLTSVGGWLQITDSTALTNLDGLSALNHVDEHLVIWNNIALSNIDGLSALISVGGGISVLVNPILAACNGLSALLDPVDDDEPGPAINDQ